MSIVKWYEVSCDICGKAINHYRYRPTTNDLKECGVKIKRINKSEIKIICDECVNKVVLDI